MAADPIAQERREACRRDVLEFLAARQAVAKHPHDIRRGLNAGHVNDYTGEEVSAALAFLGDAALVKTVTESFGATRYYQATSAGVLAHERRSL